MIEPRIVVGCATDRGPDREENEDAHGSARSGAGDIIVVCDGMGGHAAGALASQGARDALLAALLDSTVQEPISAMRAAVASAHARVRALADAAPERRGMGTTCVLAMVRGDTATVANVGDSRAYLVRGGRVALVSKDHTRAQALLDAGAITPEQYASHPERSTLSQAIGQQVEPTPHVEQLTLQANDTLVLCSDGVYESLRFEDVALFCEGNDPNRNAARLVAEAIRRDGKDNATAAVIRYVVGQPGASGFGQLIRGPSRDTSVDVLPDSDDDWRSPFRRFGPTIAIAAVALIVGVLIGRLLLDGPADAESRRPAGPWSASPRPAEVPPRASASTGAQQGTTELEIAKDPAAEDELPRGPSAPESREPSVASASPKEAKKGQGKPKPAQAQESEDKQASSPSTASSASPPKSAPVNGAPSSP
jgi:serine/threonine protein phosphatase PrpC